MVRQVLNGTDGWHWIAAALKKAAAGLGMPIHWGEGDDRASNLAAYADPNLPLAPGIIDILSTFIARESAERIAK
jgi:hypothetical protein